MSVYRRAGSAAFGRRRSPIRRRLQALAALALACFAAACAKIPATPFAEDPSDPSARAKAVTYRSTIAPYASQRPVEPAPWRAPSEPSAKP